MRYWETRDSQPGVLFSAQRIFNRHPAVVGVATAAAVFRVFVSGFARAKRIQAELCKQGILMFVKVEHRRESNEARRRRYAAVRLFLLAIDSIRE